MYLIGCKFLFPFVEIIDDLPSMDNDKLRRGEETVHVKYGVKKAYMLANKYILEAIGNILEICGKNKDDNGECKKLILKENMLK